mgnify:CR=1 FL=1
MRDLIPFQFHDQTLSILTDDGRQPWWIASEVCAALELPNVSQAVSRLDADEKQSITINDALHSELKTLIINEAGLYRLTLSSRKKSAKEFKRWVLHDVLPQIRKTGQYASALPDFHNPSTKALVETLVRVDALEYEIAQLRENNERTDAKTDLALANQQWLTIREYVFLNDLTHQMPTSCHADYGRWLTGYCQEHGIPVRKQGVADRSWEQEHAYHVETIARTLPGWLTRRQGQRELRVIATQSTRNGL